MTDTVRRAILIVGVLAVLVGVGVSSSGSGQSSGGGGSSGGSIGSGEISPLSSMAVARSGAESSAWFCAGGTGVGGNAQSDMIMTNPTPRPVTGTVTTVSTTAVPVSMEVEVPAETQIGVAPPPATTGPSASTVVFGGGGLGVTQTVDGPLGINAAPCASATSSHWYFADGSTAGGDTLSLSLFNPTDTVAVVDLSFVSSTGVVAPPAYQGIDVPADTLVTENIGDHLENDPHVATTVQSLSGAVVAAELESAGPPGAGGPSIVLGATTLTSRWSFAQNADVANGQTVFHVFNPSTRPARVTMEIGLQQGAAEPLVLRIPPESVGSITAQDVTRIPSGSTFAATFVSDGVGIVVDRHVSSPAGSPPAGSSPPAPAQGDVAGVPAGSDAWLLPNVGPPSTGVSGLAVVDLDPTPVTVRLLTPARGRLVPVAGFGRPRVRPGVPLIVSPDAASSGEVVSPGGSVATIGTEPLEVLATGPVAVELDAEPVGSPGIIVVPAMPLR